MISEVDFLCFLPKASVLSPALAFLTIVVSVLWFAPGGVAWAFRNAHNTIPGPPGIVFALSGTSAHRVLSRMASSLHAVSLMAFSVGATRFIVSSRPDTAKEILTSSAFADRPIKESAYGLLFHRAMGFAPYGEYWRGLRRISATHLFCPRRVSSFGAHRCEIGAELVKGIGGAMEREGEVGVRRILHRGSLNNVMASVFGKRFDFKEREGIELEELVREGYKLLGMFNWSDHLPIIGWMDLQGVRRRCRALVKKVDIFVSKIVDEHRERRGEIDRPDSKDFVDVLIDLEKEEKLSNSDIIAVLWEMIFRGADTVAILLEWIMARMVLHPEIQSKAQAEIDRVMNGSPVTDSDIPRLPYIQCIVKESLRMHPPGPLLSWARLSIHDTCIDNHFIPAGTTAMVNMWAITHDASVWAEPKEFRPERFLEEDVNILGSDLRLAPFGSGRRVCPGKSMGLATVHLWLALLLQNFKWIPSESHKLDLSECLNMSLELKSPLVCKAIVRS